ncbi:flippase [Thermococcus nautili]|uniref:Membrane protein involved in the export of O-antigen and teichoic acid n=1 Tax=Thermococcus nautili TaxID=195522 RepID=W8P6E6_9EURY|nr:flippase [Thermococcus nautili]AHL23100.1 Membrane protein involved in the export of O-antigen and teichoic acid [Thermococcus nautili]
MSAVRTITKNTLALMVASVVSKGLAFLTLILLARYLGSENYGKLAFAMALTSFFTVIADFGLSSLIVREVARGKEKAGVYLGTFSIFKVFLAVVVFLALVLISHFGGYDYSTKILILLFGIYTILLSYSTFFISFFRAFERMEYEALVRSIEKVFLLVLTAMFIYLNKKLVYFAVPYLASSSVAVLLALFLVIHKVDKPKFLSDKGFLVETLKESLPFALTSIFVIVYFKTDTVMLSFMIGDSAVGIYNAARNLIEGLIFLIPYPLSMALYPIMSRYALNSIEELRKVYIYGFLASLLLGLAGVLFVLSFREKIILLIYGSEYLEATKVLAVLVWTFLVICVSTISSTLLNAVNKQKIVTIGTAIGASLNVVFNYLLIPKYSYVGAAYATLITEGVGFGIYLYYTMRFLRLRTP